MQADREINRKSNRQTNKQIHRHAEFNTLPTHTGDEVKIIVLISPSFLYTCYYCCRGSVLLWLQCNMFLYSGFVDDLIFSYIFIFSHNGANGPESKTIWFAQFAKYAVSDCILLADMEFSDGCYLFFSFQFKSAFQPLCRNHSFTGFTFANQSIASMLELFTSWLWTLTLTLTLTSTSLYRS